MSRCGFLCEVVVGPGLQLHGQASGQLLALLSVDFPPWGSPSWAVELVSWQPHHCLGARGLDRVLGELALPEGSGILGAQGLHSRESWDNWPDKGVGEVLEGSRS